jgi:hypothetical protein
MAKTVQMVTPFDPASISVSQNPIFPDAYMVDLPLNSVPDDKWRETFEMKWKLSKDLWDRKLYLLQNKVRLFTTAEGFVEKLEWLERTIKETNEAIKAEHRLIDKETKFMREAALKSEWQSDSYGTEVILGVLRRRCNM